MKEIPSPKAFEIWLKRLVPALAGFTAAGLLAPAAAFGAVLTAAIAAFWARNPFAGIGLGAAMLPFGAWLVEHPSPLRLLGCVMIAAALLWWYWREIKEGLAS